jgi:hypothetical protein
LISSAKTTPTARHTTTDAAMAFRNIADLLV